MRIELRINRELASALRLASGVAFLALICAFACRLAFAADLAAGRPAKGIRAPIDYYPPPSLQVRSFLEASESEMGPNGTTIFRDAKLQTFREDGSKEMIVSAPQCLYDYNKNVVNSSGPLQVQIWDENNRRPPLQLQGSNGFCWQQTNLVLIVSNQQTTTISGPLTNSFTP
jgi:hypothetical protein